MDNNNNQNWQYTPITPEPQPQQEEPRGQAIASMVLGILSLVIGWIPGIVLACIARSKAKSFLRDYPDSSACGFANAGRITGNIGLPLSIVSTVFTVIVYIIYFAILMTNTAI